MQQPIYRVSLHERCCGLYAQKVDENDEAHQPGITPYLEGITVLDFTQYLAGPSCTRLLVEMGADVVKVEYPPYGDPVRPSPPRKNGRSAYHVQQNRGKRSLSVDLTKPEGISLIEDLIPKVDIVVENYSPGVMDRRGLGYQRLRELNPQVIMASISGFGQTGPLSEKTAFDFIAQAYSGLMHMTGEPDGPPMLIGAGIADTSTGVHAFAALGYALYRRDRTGVGSHLDIGMIDAMYHMQESAVSGPSLSDGEVAGMRTGRHYAPASPAGIFKGPKGWIVVFALENQIVNLWAALGQPNLGDDPRFLNNRTRLENRDALTEIIEIWMSSFESDEDVVAVLEQHRVPCGPVVEPVKLVETHPHFLERGTVREVIDPLAGSMLIPGFPLRFSDAPDLPDLTAAEVGEHNSAVLNDLLGMNSDAVAALEEDGVLYRRPPRE
ncbi:MAG TPA: CoA transferase [Acidimicrobiaceae bacterium]|nr:CoA transferase [Acidimicrobiaceae bacterium]